MYSIRISASLGSYISMYSICASASFFTP
jgi:hypothetical protein